MFKLRFFGSLALVALALLVAGLVPSGHAFAATHSPQHSENSHLLLNRASNGNVIAFNATIQGNIDQAITFSLPAQLYLVPKMSSGSLHPFDVCLDVGSQILPYSNPVTGAITLDSNSGCEQGFDTATDMGSITIDQSTNTLVFQVDPNASSLGVNAFNTSGGIAGGVEIVVAGGMQLQFASNGSGGYTVKGVIQVGGNESPYAGTQNDIYTATISGSTN